MRIEAVVSKKLHKVQKKQLTLRRYLKWGHVQKVWFQNHSLRRRAFPSTLELHVLDMRDNEPTIAEGVCDASKWRV